MTSPLIMLHVPVDLAALSRQAEDRSWTKRRSQEGHEREAGFDQGRALHHVLDEAFGPSRLRPFRLMAPRNKAVGTIYAYTTTSEAELREALDLAPPETAKVLKLDRLAFKAMPVSWASGRRLGFDCLARPVVRISSDIPHPRYPGDPEKAYKAGAELDAFYVEAIRNHGHSRPAIVDGEPLPSGMATAGRTREAVYCDWLASRFGQAANLDTEATTMERFQRTRVARGGTGPEGPDAVFHGTLTVGDPAAFAALLAAGVGRHKAYGYGMLLLRHPRRPAMEA
jgi:CRISPR system Cascade subunit CasE